jgi:hypothetical protein
MIKTKASCNGRYSAAIWQPENNYGSTMVDHGLADHG